jgi:hypothetical protein
VVRFPDSGSRVVKTFHVVAKPLFLVLRHPLSANGGEPLTVR